MAEYQDSHFSEELKESDLYILTEFFKYGFYVALAIWMYGICFSTFYEGSAVVRIVVIVVTFCVYISFVIGKAVVYSKYCK